MRCGPGDPPGHPHAADRNVQRPSKKRSPPTSSRTATSAWSSPAVGQLWPRHPPHQPSAGDHHRRHDLACIRPRLTKRASTSSRPARIRNHPNARSARASSRSTTSTTFWPRSRGPHAGLQEALMLNHKGEVAECTGDNIFIVRDGVLRTPAPDAGILEGITRMAVIRLARQAGIQVVEGPLTAARYLRGRRVLPDGNGRRSHRRHQPRRPPNRQRQTRPDHQRPAGKIPRPHQTRRLVSRASLRSADFFGFFGR